MAGGIGRIRSRHFSSLLWPELLARTSKFGAGREEMSLTELTKGTEG